MLSVRENLNGAGRVLRVAGKMSRVRNSPPFFLNKLLGELTIFFRIQPCYVSGNVDGNPLRIKAAFYGEESQIQKNKGGLEKRVIQNNTYS